MINLKLRTIPVGDTVDLLVVGEYPLRVPGVDLQTVPVVPSDAMRVQ